MIRAHQQVAKASRRFSVAKLDREAAWTAGGYTTRLDRAMAERRSSREEAVHSDTYEPSTSRPGRILRQQSMLPCATRLPDPRTAAQSQPTSSGEASEPIEAPSVDGTHPYSNDNFSFSIDGICTQSGSAAADVVASGGTNSFSFPRGATQSCSPRAGSVSSATCPMAAVPEQEREAVHI